MSLLVPSYVSSLSPVKNLQFISRFMRKINIPDNFQTCVAFLTVDIYRRLNRCVRILPFASAATMTDTAVMTAAKMATGIIIGTPTAAANYTTDTAANIISTLKLVVGDQVFIELVNTSAGANTITVLGGTGVTTRAATTLAQSGAVGLAFYVTAAGTISCRAV